MSAAVAPIPAFDTRKFRRVYEREMLKAGCRKGLRAKLRSLVPTLMAGFSDAVENKILDHLVGNADYTAPDPLYLALLTTGASDSSTSASLVEANYTGYARLQIPDGDWAAASGGAVATSAQKAFAACTAGSSTVIGWALSPMDGTGEAGDVVMYGTCTSVTISTTQTPATVASGALSLTLD